MVVLLAFGRLKGIVEGFLFRCSAYANADMKSAIGSSVTYSFVYRTVLTCRHVQGSEMVTSQQVAERTIRREGMQPTSSGFKESGGAVLAIGGREE